ncbi:SHOCT domain-containing protein [Dyadobacter sp. CY312]|uniref:SHOCT domain-containing protein n=1 Tax=Dyadobacter sp. CY312 TaxID=2907303 RepID=UPI001F3C0B2B|nr:SHOCT domain-containing protein [Dyadobacter sp. CY312]MCE7042796.1 SHOCT domain-containing protein [Dyadobacter sp. CY312]
MAIQTDFEITAKKHWLTFILPGIIVLMGILMLGSSTVWKVLGAVLILFNVIKLISLGSVRWTLSPAGLYVTRGILPWTKIQMQIPIFDIYESLVSFGMFGHFLGYGHISIRRTEGVTSVIGETSMTGAKEFSGQINQLVQDYKMRKNTLIVNQAYASPSISQQLKHLADLKNSGELTQDEYDTMKSRLINSEK